MQKSKKRIESNPSELRDSENNNPNRLVNITTNLPESYISSIQSLIEREIIPSRSEFVRNAVMGYVLREYTEVLAKVGYQLSDKKDRKVVTINIGKKYLVAVDRLTGSDGLYASRTELIRNAVREALLEKLKLDKVLEEV